MRSYSWLLWLTSASCSALITPSHPCAMVMVDSLGREWRFNLTNLSQPTRDYEVATDRGRVVLNVCRPPLAMCNPQGASVPVTTPSAVDFWGAPPEPPGQRCGPELCTSPCRKLGWGAVGGVGSHWQLLDHAEGRVGVRVSHYDMGTSTGDLAFTTNVTIPPATDEWGAQRPPAFTIDFECDPSAPLPSGPVLPISLSDHPLADLSVRIKSPWACPVPNPAISLASAAAAAASVAAWHAARSASNAGESAPSGFVLFLCFLIFVGAMGFLLVWLAPLSLKHSLRNAQRSELLATTWPAAQQHDWAAVGAADVDEPPSYRAM